MELRIRFAGAVAGVLLLGLWVLAGAGPAAAVPRDCPVAFEDVPVGSPDLAAARCATCNAFLDDFPCGGPGEPCGPNHYPYFRPWVTRGWTRADLARLIVLAAGWPINTCCGHYSDVHPTDYFYAYVQTTYNHGVLIDYADNTFRPYNAMNRGLLARALVNGAGWPIDTSGGPHFSDVPPDYPLYGEIETVWHHQAMLGYADGTFHPDDNLTSPRIDLAMILSITFHPECNAVPRYETTPGGGTPTPATATPTAGPATPPPSASPTATATVVCGVPCSDVHPEDYFYHAYLDLFCRAVISGYGDGTCRPYNVTTRSQLVKIVVLAFRRPLVTPTAGGYTFADVPPVHPFFAVIETAAVAGVISGYPCGGPGEPCDAQGRPYFRPYADITRGQIAKIVVLAAQWPPLSAPLATFADVPPTAPFYAYVESAACHGIISGYNCGAPGEPCDAQSRPYYRPGAEARRGQIAKIVDLAIYAAGACVASPP